MFGGGRLYLKRDGRGYFKLYSRINGRLEYICYVGKDLNVLKVLRIEGKTYLQVKADKPLLEVKPCRLSSQAEAYGTLGGFSVDPVGDS
jgi:hypothetical protein